MNIRRRCKNIGNCTWTLLKSPLLIHELLSGLFFIITTLIIRPIISSQILQVEISLLVPYISCLKTKSDVRDVVLCPQAYVHRTSLAPEKSLRGRWRNALKYVHGTTFSSHIPLCWLFKQYWLCRIAVYLAATLNRLGKIKYVYILERYFNVREFQQCGVSACVRVYVCGSGFPPHLLCVLTTCPQIK